MTTSHLRLMAACLGILATAGVCLRLSRRGVSSHVSMGTAPVPAMPLVDSSDGGGTPGLTPADRDAAARRWVQWRLSPVRHPFGDPRITRRAPSLVPDAGTSRLVLSAIWCQPGQRRAVVNGQIVAEGSELPPFRVRHIRSNAVEFLAPSGALVLGIGSERTPPTGAGNPAVAAAVMAAPQPMPSPER